MDRHLSDQDAVQRLRTGNEEALIILYNRYSDRLYRFAVRLLGNREDAEEVVAQTFLQAFRYARSYRGDGSFSGWLFTIARHQCFERARRFGRQNVASLDAILADGFELVDESWLEDLPLYSTVQLAMQRLTPDHRLILTMRDLDGMTNTEAAQVLGRSAAATKSMHFRARQALRDRVTELLKQEQQDGV